MAKQPQNQTSARKSYLYSGPVTPLETEGREPIMLYPGRAYRDLPEDHPIVVNLIERELLIAETGTAKAAEPAPASTEGN